MSWLLGALLLAPVLADVCHSRHFRELRGNEDDDYVLYGLTQDCQIFFIRPPQLTLLSTLSVNIHSSYCSPNLVQLLVKSDDILLILIKQAGNRICTLEIQIPPAEMLFGDHLFSYSILASLSYASCSHSPNNEFSLDPDLSFLDSIYRNIIYFADGNSVGEVWDVLQFLLTDEGHLQLLDKIPINNYAKNNWNGPDLANEYVLGLDAQRNYLFQRNRFEQSYVYACAFDSMFRSSKVVIHYANSTSRTYRTWLNSMSADGAFLVFTETDQTIQPAVTRIFGQNISTARRDHFCLGITNYAMDLGIIRTSTLKKMKVNPLPPLGETTTQRTTPVRKYGRMETTTMSNALWERGTTRKIVKVPKTTLKYTSVVYNTTERMVTSTRFEATTDSSEEENLYVTTPDATPVSLSTDSNDIGMMTSGERLLNNATLDALNQNRTSSTNLFSHTVSVLVLYSFI